MKRYCCCRCGKVIRDIGFFQEEENAFICGDCYFAPEPRRLRYRAKSKPKIAPQKVMFIISLLMVLIVMLVVLGKGGSIGKFDMDYVFQMMSNLEYNAHCVDLYLLF